MLLFAQQSLVEASCSCLLRQPSAALLLYECEQSRTELDLSIGKRKTFSLLAKFSFRKGSKEMDLNCLLVMYMLSVAVWLRCLLRAGLQNTIGQLMPASGAAPSEANFSVRQPGKQAKATAKPPGRGGGRGGGRGKAGGGKGKSKNVKLKAGAKRKGRSASRQRQGQADAESEAQGTPKKKRATVAAPRIGEVQECQICGTKSSAHLSLVFLHMFSKTKHEF